MSPPMSDLPSQIEALARTAIAAALGEEHASADPLVRPSGDPKFGDYQINAAMSLAKRLKRNPREVGQAIASALPADGLFEKVEVAGPGFINLTLTPAALAAGAAAMLRDDRLGVDRAKPAHRVVVDYSAPNVAKEMHIGHIRSTVIGDAIVRVLDFAGHEVIRQNHLGDWGTQFGRVMLGLWYEAVAKNQGQPQQLDAWIAEAKAVPKRKDGEQPAQRDARLAAERALLDKLVPWHLAALASDPQGTGIFAPYLEGPFPDLSRLQELYTFATTVSEWESAKAYTIGDQTLAALPSLIATFVQQQDLPQHAQERVAWQKSLAATVASCQALYDRLGVLLTPEDIRGESAYNAMLPDVIFELQRAGQLEEDQGALVVRPQGFTNAEGGPMAMIVRKRDGGFLYATTDLAAARYRLMELKADRVIYVTDARQSQHFAMVFQTLRQSGWVREGVRLDHVPFGTILGADRRPFKSRSGDTVRLAEVVDEAESRAAAIVAAKNPDMPADEQRHIAHAIGIGALKYGDLSNDRIKDYVFDWDRMLAFEGNTAPYLQYSYVRIRSIFRKGGLDPAAADPGKIAVVEPAERRLVLQLSQFAPTVASVADSLEPHRLCNYLYELASQFHKFFETCPVLQADPATRDSRLALCALTAKTLERGLGLLGIEVVEQM